VGWLEKEKVRREEKDYCAAAWAVEHAIDRAILDIPIGQVTV
jgi:hypothetical protein